MNDNDRLRLQHMLDIGDEVASFIDGETRQSLDSDRKLMRALAMSLGIIGEAAGNLTPEMRDLMPQVPWRQIIAMRNILIHEYFNVDLDILWDSAIRGIPELLDEVEQVMAGDTPS